MTRVIPLAVALPLLAAAVLALFERRVAFQRIVGLGTSAAVLALGVALIVATADGGTLAHHVGDWRPRFAITLAADMFSSLMLVVSALMVVVCSAFAVARDEDRTPFFHPLVQVLLAGIAGAFLTADLFNLFVFFEVMLIASYVLLTLPARPRRIRAGAVYVTTSLLGSTLLLAGVALTYASIGTVNFGVLVGAARETPVVTIAGGLLLVAFAVKAAVVPVHGWLPVAYPAARPATAALFSGLLTKVGVYAMYRVYAVMFDGDPAFRPLLLWIASATLVVGILGALGQNGMRPMLSLSLSSHIGYMIMGLGLFGPLGLAGGIFYILQHMVVKTSLFLNAGAVETMEGSGDFDRLGGLARRHSVLASSFIIAALGLAGIPPLSGFFAKLLLVRAAFESADYAVAAVAVAVSFLTLIAMVKIWNCVYWGDDPFPEPGERPHRDEDLVSVAGGAEITRRRSAALIAPAVVLALVAIAIGFGAEGLYRLAATAAEGLVDVSRYVEAVTQP